LPEGPLMTVTRRSCPTCRRTLRISQDLPARVKCPQCGTGFQVTAEPNGTPAEAPPSAAPAPAAAARSWKRLFLLAGVGLVVLFGVPLLIVYLTSHGPGETGTPRNEGTNSTAQNGKDKDAGAKKGDAKPKEDLPKGKKDATPADKKKGKTVEPLPGIPVPAGPPKLKVKLIETVTKEAVEPKPLRLAVTPPGFDNMGKLLSSLGAGYAKYTPISEADIYSYERLRDYDVVFLTCSPNPKKDRDLYTALRRFVERGGTLYASDLRFSALEGAFPEYLAKKITEPGAVQDLTARVVEAGLREALGRDEIPLKFPSTIWKPACFDRAKATVYIEGWYETVKKRKAFAPLLVRFHCGKGTVIFTSFHNAEQNSEVELKLLRYLVFTAVTSHVERRVLTTMISGDFSPEESRRVVLSPDENKKVTATYKHKQAGPLRFALGFAEQGARLKLTLVSPDGSKVEKEGTATFTVEIANAPAGDWQYTVTALRVPFPNFPFTLTVGEQSKR
jgi:hypothetical protein